MFEPTTTSTLLAVFNSTGSPDGDTNISLVDEQSASDSNDCSEAGIPSMRDYLQGLSLPYIVTFVVLGLGTLTVICVFVEESLRLSLSPPSVQRRRDKARWLLAVYPVMCVTSFVSLLIPRSANVNELVASIYVSVCVYIFVSMLIDLYGGPVEMLRRLTDSRMRFDVPPLCCCLPCLPTVKLTRTWLQILRTMAIQFAVIRPFIGYMLAVIWSDLLVATTHSESSASNGALLSRCLGLVYTLSALVAMWSFAMVFRVSATPLRQFHVVPKFFCFQSVVLVSSIQPAIINVCALVGWLGCDASASPALPASSVAKRWNNMLVIGEVLLLSVAARAVYFVTEDDAKTDVEAGSAKNGDRVRAACHQDAGSLVTVVVDDELKRPPARQCSVESCPTEIDHSFRNDQLILSVERLLTRRSKSCVNMRTAELQDAELGRLPRSPTNCSAVIYFLCEDARAAEAVVTGCDPGLCGEGILLSPPPSSSLA